jgi:protease-4
MTEAPPPTARRSARTILLWVALPLLAGIVLSLLVPRPVVGVIHLDDQIFSVTAQDLIAQITYAREHPEVRAVVLAIDSPGGTVVDTEAIYLELARLRRVKPVVAVINGMAASGAYYMAVGADYIYAKPTSEVGNIGVINVLPIAPLVFEDQVSTGPYKLWGNSRDTSLREMEMIKQEFYTAVRLGRGPALKAGQETILRGEIWPGTVALRLGLIDELGVQSQAVERAAGMARIANYSVADLRASAGLAAPQSGAPGGKATPASKPGLYLLYIRPSEGSRP